MKRIALIFILLLIVGGVNAGHIDLGLVTTSDVLTIPITCMNDTGLVVRPDSGHIWVRFEGEATANSASYTARWATGGATDATVDSFQIGGVDYWYFFDAIADIDNDEGEGNYVGMLSMFADGQPTHNTFSFILYDIESEVLWDSVGITESIATGAVTAAVIADDAIDYATFAGTAPTAWWNEGKTGYSSDMVSISGDATAANNLEDVYNEDGVYSVTMELNHLVVISQEVDSSGIYAIGNGLGSGIEGIGGATINSNGIVGKSAASKGDGIVGIASGSGADIKGDITGNITGNLYGSVSSVTDPVVADDTLSNGDTVAVMPSEWVADDSTAYQGAAGSLDSAAVSRIVGRMVWGIPAGSGSDSSSASQRTVQKLVELDEDNTTIDINATTIGAVSNVVNMDQGTIIRESSPEGWDATDSSKIQGIIDDILTTNHGSGSWTSGSAGSGTDTLKYYAKDTCNGVYANGVTITCRTIGGVLLGSQTTRASGYVFWYANTNDTLIFTASWTGQYTWHIDTVVGVTNGTVDSINGCAISPPATPSASGYVSAYIDLGTGLIDSTTGDWIPRDKLKLTMNLLGDGGFFTMNNIFIIPVSETKEPDSNGRVTFQIPGNDAIDQAGTYYELSFFARDGREIRSGIIRKFVIDTLTNPINIKNTTKVY